MRSKTLLCALFFAVGCSEPSDGGDVPTTGALGGASTPDSSVGGGTPGGGISGGGTTGGMPSGASSDGGSGSSGGLPGSTPGGGTPGTAMPGTAGGATGMSGATGGMAGGMPGGTSGTDAGMVTPPADSGAPVEEPQTCDGSATGKPGRTNVTIDVGGVSRKFILSVPSSYDGKKPVPLMLNFHPLLTSASTAEGSSGYKAVSDKQGFIVAFPDGLQNAAWNVGGTCCTRDQKIDDVGFARAIVKDVASKFCVDKKRVYASGFSMGAGMAHFLACEAADVFAAIATGHFDLLAENPCKPSRPITVFSYRSMSDLIVPYEGGRKTSAPNGFSGQHTFLGAQATFKKWAELDGCTGEPVDESGGCKTYKQCMAGVEVTLCTVGGGHAFPDAAESWNRVSRFSMP